MNENLAIKHVGRTFAYWLTFIFILVPICSVASTITIDQEQSYTNYSSVLLGGLVRDSTGEIFFQDIAQTFTVGVSGNIVSVDFALQRNSNAISILTLSIREISQDGLPIGYSLGSSTISTSIIPRFNHNNFTSFDFSSTPIFASAGTTLALTMEYSGVEPDFLIGRGGQNHYGRGQAWNNLDDRGWSVPHIDGDFGFRTYVETSTVPVPAALWLLISGVLGLAGVAKHKKA